MLTLLKSCLAGRGECPNVSFQLSQHFSSIMDASSVSGGGQSHLNLKRFICRPQLHMFLEGYFLFNRVSNLRLQSSLLVLLQASSWFSPKERRLRSRSHKSATTSSIARGRLIRPRRTWPGWPSSRNRGRTLPRRENRSGKVRRRHLEFPLGWTSELVSNIHLETNW